MDPFVSTTERYDRTIRDARDGTEWTATYRPLTAGDRAVLQDLTRMAIAGDTDEQATAEMRLGAAQILTLDRALVDWNLPLAKTRATIEALHPDIFDALFEHVSWGSIPDEPVLEAERTTDPLASSNDGQRSGSDEPTAGEPSSDKPESSPTDD